MALDNRYPIETCQGSRIHIGQMSHDVTVISPIASMSKDAASLSLAPCQGSIFAPFHAGPGNKAAVVCQKGMK